VSSLLNPSQLAAVEHDQGPLLVLAGAGSGKTRVVTHRIFRLLERGVPAWSIVAMTFTNKAATEMRERVAQLTGPKVANELRIMTFHSFGLNLLTRETHALGFRNGTFSIFDQADCVSTLREILRGIDAGRRFDVAAIQGRISVAKNSFQTPETWIPREGDEYDEIAHSVYPRYVASLRSFQAFDFDDLVTEAVRLLKEREDVRRIWQLRIRYLLVDEYQDTNASQLELVRVLCGTHNNVMVVGDDDQAIYGWRGADIRNILDFPEHFPGSKIVKLEENYRSTGAVLDVANAVLAKSQARRHGKQLRATREQGQKVELWVCSDSDMEALAVADEVEKILATDSRLRAGDIAVLYRSNGQAQPIEVALKERGIHAKVLGGQRFYERKEVKDLLAYLKVAVQPDDEQSLRRVLNYPSRGIGEVALERISLVATARDLSLYDAVERAQSIDALPSTAIEGCEAFCQIIKEVRQRLLAGTPSHEVATELAERIGLRADLLAASQGEVFARRWRNVETFFAILKRRDEKMGHQDFAALAEYFRFLLLRTEDDEEAAGSHVTLCTIHGAKGLEFPVVFLPGLEEGLLPHNRTLDARATDVTDQDIEEERRLFYVAVTRARERLILMRAKTRLLRGKPTARTPSRFVCEIAEELLDQREITVRAPPSPTQLATGAASLLAALGTERPTGRQAPLGRMARMGR